MMLVLDMSGAQHYEPGYISKGCRGGAGEIARAGLRRNSTESSIGSGAQFVVEGGIAETYVTSDLWAWKSKGWGGA